MAALVAGDVDVDVDVKDYGSTHDEERVVPSGMMMEEYPSSSPPSWKTKKLMCAGIIGMTAAVASSTLLFLSIMELSGQAQTEESFLLHDSGPYSKCVPASGPWPTNSVSQDDDGEKASGASDGPYVTCFEFQGGENHCWSHSYIDGWGNWQPCLPNGYGVGWESGSLKTDDYTSGTMGVSGHTFVHLSDMTTCGLGCQEFSSEVPGPH